MPLTPAHPGLQVPQGQPALQAQTEQTEVQALPEHRDRWVLWAWECREQTGRREQQEQQERQELTAPQGLPEPLLHLQFSSASLTMGQLLIFLIILLIL